jgi:hypothetical protein
MAQEISLALGGASRRRIKAMFPKVHGYRTAFRLAFNPDAAKTY